MIITRRAWTTTWQIELSINSHVYEQTSDHIETTMHKQSCQISQIYLITLWLVKIPKYICRDIDITNRNFSGMITKKKIINNHQSTSKLAWNNICNICNICKPKCEGGLGIRKLRILILLRKIGMAHSYIYIYVDMNRPYEHNECIWARAETWQGQCDKVFLCVVISIDYHKTKFMHI